MFVIQTKVRSIYSSFRRKLKKRKITQYILLHYFLWGRGSFVLFIGKFELFQSYWIGYLLLRCTTEAYCRIRYVLHSIHHSFKRHTKEFRLSFIVLLLEEHAPLEVSSSTGYKSKLFFNPKRAYFSSIRFVSPPLNSITKVIVL